MDLIDFLAKYGRPALTELAARAGISSNYLYQLMGGFRRVSLANAQKLNCLHDELDVVSLQRMKDRIMKQKKRAANFVGARNGKKQTRVRRSA